MPNWTMLTLLIDQSIPRRQQAAGAKIGTNIGHRGNLVVCMHDTSKNSAVNFFELFSNIHKGTSQLKNDDGLITA